MDNRSLTLKTGIELNLSKLGKLMREIIDAEPDKGMSITIKEVNDLQKWILKDVKLLNKYYLEEGERMTINQNRVNLIIGIVDRGWEGGMKEKYPDKLNMMMDIDTADRDCPLKLQELLDAEDFDFYHDIVGIHNNLNRKTKKLENCFVPRYAKGNKEPDLIEDDRAYNQDLIQRASDEDML